MNPAWITDRYLGALGLGRTDPSLSFLREIIVRHLSRFPFSNVSVWLGHELPLDLESIAWRVIVQGRGGYCFELNGLLYGVLEELGFSPRLCMARVMLDKSEPTGLTHRITLVDLEGERYLVDGGFGPWGPRQPIGLSQTVIREPGRAFRVTEPQAGDFHLQTATDGDFQSLYRFELAHYNQADCELGHFYSHRHPQAPFVNNLVAARILDDQIRSLRNRDYWIIDRQGRHQRTVSDAQMLRSVLDDEFGIVISADESCTLFARLPFEPLPVAGGGP
jgi:N-hydroxyarylamine O-acetyltransferase